MNLMAIPEVLINEARRRGIDIIDVLAKVLNLDSSKRD